MKKSLRRKNLLAVSAVALALLLVAVVTSYTVYSNTMDRHYERLTRNIAQTAADVLTVEQVKPYADAVKAIYLPSPSPENADDAYFARFAEQMDEGHETLKAALDTIRAANEADSLYIVYMDPASMTCVYIADPDPECPPGTWDLIYEQNFEAMTHPQDGFPAYITNTEWGWLCSAGAAIMDGDEVVAHVMVDVSMDDIMQDRYDFLLRLCMLMVGVSVVCLILLMRGTNRLIVKPIKQLEAAASSYVGESDGEKKRDRSAIEALDIHTGDEIERLSTAIKQMEKDIDDYITNLAEVTAEKERIGAELNVATEIQASMLPCIFPPFPDRDEFDIFASMHPAKEVGGDFYDFFMVDDKHLAMVMADVSGKGVPAALFMVIGKTLIKDHTQPGTDLGKVFTQVNQLLCEANKEGMFITAWEGVLNLETGEMTFVNAGHELPFISRQGNPFEVYKCRAGFVLAGMDGIRYRAGTMQLEPGDRLYLYTDGVTEATNAQLQLFGSERLRESLNRIPDLSPDKLLQQVKQDVDAFVGAAPQFDDITMLCMHFKRRMGGESERITIPASVDEWPRLNDMLEERLGDAGCPMKTIMQILVCTEEAFVNVAHYAYAPATGDVDVIIDIQPHSMTLTLEDSGKPYNPLEREDPDITLSADERAIGGLGIYMVKNMMDKVNYSYRNGKNVLTMRKEF